ncbi:hypothetical protein [Paraburkholderia bengalensis]|uniref:VOC family protein n=1 Tax=Paraburkholderia bengalensis TaxID=2747562 RepID=UPI0030145CE3
MDNASTKDPRAADIADFLTFDMKLEIVVIPVTDVDRGTLFYIKLGWQLDLDYSEADDYRAIQFTPPGRDAQSCSVKT